METESNSEMLRRLQIEEGMRQRPPVVELTDDQKEAIIGRNLQLIDQRLHGVTRLADLTLVERVALHGAIRIEGEPNLTVKHLMFFYRTATGEIAPIPPTTTLFLPGDYSRFQSHYFGDERRIEVVVPPLACDSQEYSAEELAQRTLVPARLDSRIADYRRSAAPARSVNWGQSILGEDSQGDHVFRRSLEQFNQR